MHRFVCSKVMAIGPVFVENRSKVSFKMGVVRIYHMELKLCAKVLGLNYNK